MPSGPPDFSFTDPLGATMEMLIFWGGIVLAIYAVGLWAWLGKLREARILGPRLARFLTRRGHFDLDPATIHRIERRLEAHSQDALAQPAPWTRTDHLELPPPGAAEWGFSGSGLRIVGDGWQLKDRTRQPWSSAWLS